MGREARLYLSEVGADTERLDTLARILRQELLQLEVEDVAWLPAGQPPPGSRAVDVAAVGGLLVTLSQSVEGLRSVVLTVKSWLMRGDRTHRTVRLEIDGDVLEVSEASPADQQRLIDFFIGRHAAGDGGYS